MTVTQIVDINLDVMPFLRLTGTAPAPLQDTINAAQVVIEDIVGHVVNVNVGPEYQDGGDVSIWLYETPVLAVDTITEIIGLVPYTLTLQPVGQPVDNFGYSIDDQYAGRITRRSAGSQAFEFYDNTANVIVTYVAGTATVAPNVKEATKELIRHMYSFGQQSLGATSSYVPNGAQGDSMAVTATPSGFLVPNRVMELCQPTRRPIVIA